MACPGQQDKLYDRRIANRLRFAGMTLSKRLKWARQRARLTQEQVAAKVGVTQQTYGGWEKGKHSLRWERIEKLAAVLGVNAEWLAGHKGAANPDDANVGPAPAARMVPLISWTRAGEWSEAVDPYEPGVADDWYPSPRPVSEAGYCLRVVGDSMYNPGGRVSIPEGSIIIVDPARRAPENGQVVIARLAGTSDVTCKAYREDAGRRYLSPLNPQYPLITDEFEIIGTVVGQYQDLAL
ncbi:MAG: LexA family protein [Salinirussus sp.]